MTPADRHLWLGLLSSDTAQRNVAASGPRGRGKRNVWIVVAFFLLILMAWIDSQA